MSTLIRRVSNRELGNIHIGWDPFQVMRDMLHWDPLREDGRLPVALRPSYTPSFDVRESQEAFHFHADLPGLKQSDLEITFNGNQLSIAGHREEEKVDDNDRVHTSERRHGTFVRSFTLPDGIDPDSVTAELTNGVLRVVVPKKTEAPPRKIAITVKDDKKASA